MLRRYLNCCFLIVQLTAFVSIAGAREQLIGADTDWHYHDRTAPPPGNWMDVEYDASGWKTGNSPFGADYPGTATPIAQGLENVPTTYFRTTFECPDTSALRSLDFWVRANDAVILILDGKVIDAFGVEQNSPRAPTSISHSPGDSFRKVQVNVDSAQAIQSGEHTLAVAVFQSPNDPQKMCFDLQLFAINKGVNAEEAIAFKSEWRFHDDSEPPLPNWNRLDYDDSGWKSGPALLGYGDSDVTTALSFGADKSRKPITARFRKVFDVSSRNRVPDSMEVQFVRDDAAAIFLNGIEIVRNNLPSGRIDESTLALETQSGNSERFLRRYPVDPSYLRPGRNVIAVRVHQSDADSSDLSFDLRLTVFYRAGTWQWDEATAPKPEMIDAVEVTPSIVNVNDSRAIKAASSKGWRTTAVAMQDSAVKAYSADQLEQAARRYAAGRWATEFAGDARALAPELKQYLLSTDATTLSLEFFDLLSPKDKTKKVYAILNRIYASSPEKFKTYPGLALAISFVYDQPPPRRWPHSQVSQSLLPRTLPDPVEAFSFWASADRRGKTLHALDKLQLEELKYVVDVPVSIEKLEAALGERARLTGMTDLYTGITYDTARFQNGVYNWPHASYELDAIKKLGGICVDQAYFTTTVAKAHGVPSMLVSGAGQDGNHAWVGFLGKKTWDFETGRYPESKFVTGTMFDPQTWEQPTDHEIAFLSERFRGQSKYRTSRIHARFAREFLASGAVATSEKAARAAIQAESRNLDAWTTLLKCLDARKAMASELETVLNDAAKAFSRYADMESEFLEQLAALFASQGKTKEADKLRKRIVRRNSEDRPDLALAQAKSELDNLIKTKSVKEQVTHYKSVINKLDDAGLIAYYALTDPFLRYLFSRGEAETARAVLKHTQRRLKASREGQLGEALAQWETRLTK